MKSKKLLMALFFISAMGLVGCSGSSGSGSGGQISKSKEVNLSFNALDELEVKFEENAEKNLEEELLKSIDSKEIIEDIKASESAIRNSEAQIVEKKVSQLNLNQKIRKVDGKIVELKADHLNKHNELQEQLNNRTDISSSLKARLENLEKESNLLIENHKKQKRKETLVRDQSIELKNIKKNLGTIDSIFESISGVLTDQIERLDIQLDKEKRKTLEIAEKVGEKKHHVDKVNSEIEAANNKVQIDKREIIKTLKAEVLKLSNQVEDLGLERKNLGANGSTLENEIALLESQKAEMVLKLDKLNEEKGKKANIESLEHNTSAAAMKLRIIKALRKGNASIKEIAKALIAVHNESNENNVKTNEDMITEMTSLSEVASTNMIEDFKPTYEDILSTKYHNDVGLTYNKDFYRLTDLPLNNKVQCYSGTLFFNAINELSNRPFENTVIILTKGHVLPGYISQEDGKLYLKGIETTAAGKALINYGETKYISGAIRVFDAKQFLLAELLRNEISDFNDIYGQMLKSVERYGFKTNQFYNLEESKSRKEKKKQFNVTSFGFGSANVPSGDLQRELFNDSENSDFKTIPVEEDPREYGELLECKSLNLVLGDQKILNMEARCRDDEGHLVNLSSYKANPIHNSASIKYSVDGERKEAYLIDSYTNYSACTIHKNRDEFTFNINLETDQRSAEMIYNELPMFLLRAGTNFNPETVNKKEFLKRITLNTSQKPFVELMNKLRNTSLQNGTNQVSNIDLSVEFFENELYKTLGETTCKVSASKLKLSGLPSGLNYITTLDNGIKIEISCPDLQSDIGSIEDVEIKANCTISEQTYDY